MNIEKIVEEFDCEFYSEHEKRGLTYLRNDVVGWLRATLTTLQAEHEREKREIMAEMSYVLVGSPLQEFWSKQQTKELLEKIEEIATRRGLTDKNKL